MSLDDYCNTTLVLGLGLTKDGQKKINKPSLKAGKGFEPCLSLGLCEGSYDDSKGGSDHRPLSRQESVTSSSLQTRVALKREREVVGSEEVETTERVSSRVSDEDDDGNNSITKKLRLNKDQSAVLEESFKMHSTLNPNQKQELARKLNLRARQVEVWFQNRRARTKVKQTEVDCEFLKKCCDTLTEENKKLQKELQELKAVKLTRPLYLHMPASALTMCPSCETISGNADSINKIPKKSIITDSPKGHFLINPFGKSSAAC